MSLTLAQLATGYARRPVLQGIDLPNVPSGTLLAVLGPNGVGKSTLLKALAGLRPVQGLIASAEASRILQRLCFHFSRKVSAHYDAHQGQVHFPWGQCAMQAHDKQLHLICQAQEAEQLARVREVIDQHVALLFRKHALTVQWQAIQALP